MAFSIRLLVSQATGECIGKHRTHVRQALRPLRTGAVRRGLETFVDPIIDIAYIKTSSSSGR
jgi:hypothetical protein